MWITVSVIDEVLEAREERRSACSASRRPPPRKAAEEEALRDRPLRRRIQERLRSIDPREHARATVEGVVAMNPVYWLSMAAVRIYSDFQAAREVRRELAAAIERRTAELESGLGDAAVNDALRTFCRLASRLGNG